MSLGRQSGVEGAAGLIAALNRLTTGIKVFSHHGCCVYSYAPAGDCAGIATYQCKAFDVLLYHGTGRG